MAKKAPTDASATASAPVPPAPAGPDIQPITAPPPPPALPPPPPAPPPSEPPEQVEVAVLRDCWLGRVDDILTLPRGIADAATADGAVDPHPKAIEAIKKQRASARGASVMDDALED
ncbi:hypothetical protein WKR98_23075 [Pigmentiphaga sp. YJ18]|uniref:hypothetical protein n=1 Tax=Pigmentiphaga sp. YJ18 TaxID=3134907 RepID=UPI003111E223